METNWVLGVVLPPPLGSEGIQPPLESESVSVHSTPHSVIKVLADPKESRTWCDDSMNNQVGVALRFCRVS